MSNRKPKDQTATPTKADAPAAAPNRVLARLGHVQALVTIRGTGFHQVPYAQFSKLPAPSTPPESAAEEVMFWSMEDVAALRALCDQILDHSGGLQTVLIGPEK